MRFGPSGPPEWSACSLPTMRKPLLLDSDVLIDYLRSRSEAVAYLEAMTSAPLLSVVVIAELFSGVRDGEERTRLEALVASARVLLVDEHISTQA